MRNRSRRVTLIARRSNNPDFDWNYVGPDSTSVAFLESMTVLRDALVAAVTEVGLDVGRVIVDRAGNAEEFLGLLTSLPPEFNGDVLLIRMDGTGVMSATARGGDRVLYSLMAHDVRFYLETHNLVTGRTALGLTA
ncbi:MAG: hypothetical protein ABI779_13100 [Acidobacteriota bacterium]